ncbi:MAG: GIY-YIG nuclease family protein [Methanobacterium sp.]
MIERTNVNYYMPNRIFGDSEGSINEFKDYIYLKELEHKRKLDESQSKYYEAKWEYEKLKTDLNLYKPEGYVYFIGSKENNVVKIGYSLNPKKRLQQLQTSIPYKLKLYGVIPGIIDKEIELQKLFAKYNINNEWFEFNDEIMVVINAINIMNNLNISKEKLELLKEQQEIAIEWKRKMDSLKAKTKRKKEKEAKKAWEIVKDGKTLYSNPELILGQKEFLEPAALISYNFGEIPQKDKMYVKRQLYGYRVKKVYKDKKYVSEKEGIVSKHGKKIGRAAFIIEAKNTDEIMKLFDERKVKYSLNKIWL